MNKRVKQVGRQTRMLRSMGLGMSSLLGVVAIASAADVPLQTANLNAEPPPVQSVGMPPDAATGECYGKVEVPAVYESEMIDVLLQDAHQSYRITPAWFEERVEQIVRKPAHRRIVAVQPEFESQEQTIELLPSSTRWVRDSLKGNQVLSAGERLDLENSGIDLAAAPMGACYHELYQEPLTSALPEQVLVREASEKLSVSPAEFADDTIELTLKDAHRRIIEIPAVFRTDSQQVLVEPASSVWQTGKGSVQGVDTLTGEIMRRVDLPARYATVETRVLETPAITTTIDEAAKTRQFDIKTLVSDARKIRTAVPAMYGAVMKPRVDRPAAFAWVPRKALGNSAAGDPTGRVACRVEVPAVTADYERQIVVEVGHFESQLIEADIESVSTEVKQGEASSAPVQVPAHTDRLERRTRVQPARVEWRPVLCEPAITRSMVTQLQSALKREGHSPGTIDGLLGRGTMRAVHAWQKANNMASGGLTIDTLKGLDVKL